MVAGIVVIVVSGRRAIHELDIAVYIADLKGGGACL
jgi:hypothetical protein